MRILVTGGAGFMGSDFVRSALSDRSSAELMVLDAFNYSANAANLPSHERLEVVTGDIRDETLIDNLTRGKDVIVNFAAHSHNDRSLLDPAEFLDTNSRGVLVLLEAARRHGVHLHHISTDEVFGDLPLDSPGIFAITSPYRPSSPYSASKAAGDVLLQAWHRSFGVSVSLSHSTNNYGPHQHVEKFIARQIVRGLRGQPLQVYGDGHHSRDWIHVRDHSDAIWRILDHLLDSASTDTHSLGDDLPRFGIATGQVRSNLDVAHTIATELGTTIEFVADRPGHDVSYRLETAEINALGWEPTICWDAGLRQTIDWYRNNPHWWEPIIEESEAFYRERRNSPDRLR